MKPPSNMHKARKRFGQNFLIDQHVIQQITNQINGTSLPVIEIGPGQGALTKTLLKIAKDLTIIEIDRDLIANLSSYKTQYPALNIICEDALQFDFTKCLTHPSIIIGNLPYNIATPLLFKLFEYTNITKMIFMLQKEVVDRMTAKPHTKAYGRLSLMTQYFCTTTCLFDVPPTAFSPVPKVDSAVIELIPHHQYALNKPQYVLLNTLIQHAFMQRRKTLNNSLKKFISTNDLLSLNIDPILRAENLSLNDYIRICDYLSQDAPHV